MQTIRHNATINAPTQYTNFNFTSMCVFNGVVLGAGPDGLFKCCCGDSDNGEPIDAYFTPYNIDFDKITQKRLRRAYVGGLFDGNITLTVTGNGNSVNGPFSTNYNSNETSQVNMFSITRGQGFKWVYASFKFENVDGSFFAIDSATVFYKEYPIRRRH